MISWAWFVYVVLLVFSAGRWHATARDTSEKFLSYVGGILWPIILFTMCLQAVIDTLWYGWKVGEKEQNEGISP